MIDHSMVIHQGQFSAARIWPIAMKAFFGTVIFYSSYRLKFITFRVPLHFCLINPSRNENNSNRILDESFRVWILSHQGEYKTNSDPWWRLYSYIYSIYMWNLIIIIVSSNISFILKIMIPSFRDIEAFVYRSNNFS